MKFSRLTAPGSISKLQLRNRMLMAPMGSNLAEDDGRCGERLINYYARRAEGGAAMLIVETTSICWPAGTTMPRQIGLSDECFLPGLTQLAEAVQRQGGHIAIQLNHGGKVSQQDVAAGRPVLVPSIPRKSASDMFASLTDVEIGTFIKAAGSRQADPEYLEMKPDDIRSIVAQFASAAALVKNAGFDAIEIHAGHGYLLASFISPHSNRRTDSYGGCVENRARFLLEVIEAVRAEVGLDYPIICRLDAKEYCMDDGIEVSDAICVAKMAEAAGCDAIDVSAYASSSSAVGFTEAPLVHKPGGFIEYARKIKQAVTVPVICVGRIEPEVADQSIAAGDFDFMAMGRKLLADPDLPNKIIAGNSETIRPCIYCYVCVSKIFLNQPLSCATNPGCGSEQTLDVITPARKQKHVLVIGSGPGGMEAARVLALRGHRVSLWEKERNLGGTARIAALAYEPNGRLIRYLQQSIEQLPIAITLGKTATEQSVTQFSPDAVVVATGARREAPDIPGKHLRHVFDGEQLRGILFGADRAATQKLGPLKALLLYGARLTGLTKRIHWMRWLSHFYMPFGKRITIIGGGLVGLEVAELLAERGREVTVLEPGKNLGAELSIVRRWRVLHELAESKVQLVTYAQIEKIEQDGVHYSIDGSTHVSAANQVIIAQGAEADSRLIEALTRTGIEACAIGDCQQVGYIEGAMLAGREVGLRI